MTPADLITPGARWQPGAWTPARCELWRQMDEAGKDRLQRWIMAEANRTRCHATQLPEIEHGRTAA